MLRVAQPVLHGRLRLELLKPDQYREAADWNYEGFEECEYEWFRQLIERSNRLNYAVYLNNKFCAYISLELIEPDTVRFHVAKKSHSIDPKSLADLLITMADYLFQNGIEVLEAAFPAGLRTARRLAIRSWMKFKQKDAEEEVYAIKKESYYQRIGNMHGST